MYRMIGIAIIVIIVIILEIMSWNKDYEDGWGYHIYKYTISIIGIVIFLIAGMMHNSPIIFISLIFLMYLMPTIIVHYIQEGDYSYDSIFDDCFTFLDFLKELKNKINKYKKETDNGSSGNDTKRI